MALVMLTSYSGAFGGAERALLDFAAGLDADCCLACPPGPLFDAAVGAGVRAFPVAERRLELRGRWSDRVLAAWRIAAHGAELRRLARDLEPELVIACGMRSALAIALGPAVGAPVVFLHNDLLPGRIVGRAVRAAARRAELVIVPSQAVADELGGGVGARVVSPGVDVERLAAVAADADPAGPPEVLVLGAIVEWKRPDLALEAVARVRRVLPDARLRVVGAPLDAAGEDLLARLRARARGLGLSDAVEFAGAVADPREALARASCLLHCAPREPFGLVVAEALAAGRPVVAPDAAGPAEIADPACAVLYPPGDADAAAAGLVEVLSDRDRAREMGEHGRARARSLYDLGAARVRFARAVGPLVAASADAGARSVGAAGQDLALLTVTHNSARELEALLRSVDRHLPGTRVVVVDCASRDDTLAVARLHGRSVTVIPLAENVGFGRACNRGLTEIDEPVTALVNPDVELLDGSLLALAGEAVRGDRPERLLAPLVLSADGSRQDTAHPRPAAGAELVRALIPPALLPGRLGVALAPWRSARPRPVGWAVGCAVVARTATLRRLGPFDERIFMYGEDLDLGLVASAAGVETWFWPSSRVLHHGGHSTDAAFGGEPFAVLAQARHDVVRRRLGPRRAQLDDAAQAVTFASRFAIKRALGHGAERERRQLRGLRAVRRG